MIKLRKTSFDISRIDLLEKVGERLETLSRELTREGHPRNNPDLEKQMKLLKNMVRR